MSGSSASRRRAESSRWKNVIAPGRKILQTLRPCSGWSTSATRARKPGESVPSILTTGNGIVHVSLSVSTRSSTRSRRVGSFNTSSMSSAASGPTVNRTTLSTGGLPAHRRFVV